MKSVHSKYSKITSAFEINENPTLLVKKYEDLIKMPQVLSLYSEEADALESGWKTVELA